MRPGNRAWQTGSRRNTQRGFTLIELLIAISLMAPDGGVDLARDGRHG